MTLREYTLSQMSISGITQKAIDKDGLGHVLLISVSGSDRQLDMIFGVQSSHNENKHVDPHGRPQPFLKNEYAVRMTFTGLEKIVPKGWMNLGIQKAKQFISQIVRNCDVKVSCDCPAFYWQGMWEDDSKKNTSYFSFMGTNGKGIWSAKHQDAGVKQGQQMCKHMWAASYRILDRMDEIIQKLGIKDIQQQPKIQQQTTPNEAQIANKTTAQVTGNQNNPQQQQQQPVQESALFNSIMFSSSNEHRGC